MTLRDFVWDIPDIFRLNFYKLIALVNLFNVNLCWLTVFVTLNVSSR